MSSSMLRRGRYVLSRACWSNYAVDAALPTEAPLHAYRFPSLATGTSYSSCSSSIGQLQLSRYLRVASFATSSSPTDSGALPKHEIPSEDPEEKKKYQDESEMGEEDFKTVLLQGALKYVDREGWSKKSLQLAAQDLSLSPMFAGVCSERDLVVHFISECNKKLATKLDTAGPEFHASPIREKLKVALRWRLEMLSPHIRSWPQALSILAGPQHVKSVLSLMVEMVTTIWSSVDSDNCAKQPDKYIKLLALQAVYSTTELYMLTDFSPSFSDTWQALDRRVDDLITISGGAQHMEQSVLEALNKIITFGRLR